MSRVIASKTLIAKQKIICPDFVIEKPRITKLFQTADGQWHQIWHEKGRVLIRDIENFEEAKVLPEVKLEKCRIGSLKL